jgi:hypothetical protein
MVLSGSTIAIFRAAARCAGIGSAAILRNHLNQDICKNKESPYSSQCTHGERNNSSLGHEGLKRLVEALRWVIWMLYTTT